MEVLLVQFTKAGPLVTLDEICRAFLPGYIDWLNFDVNRFTSCLFSISNDEPPCLEWLEQAVESFWKRLFLRLHSPQVPYEWKVQLPRLIALQNQKLRGYLDMDQN